ncbi:hypothetical protein [Streptomyces sp. AGS-58]|uniref:hypothetical protein n=1 Tax=unclassified Streptomyces TaxID=2593676 RepID=UPI0035A27884
MKIFPGAYRITQVATAFILATSGLIGVVGTSSATVPSATPTLACVSDADLGIPGNYLYCDNGVTYDQQTGQPVHSSGHVSEQTYQNIKNAIG